ncbi:hypothetical protein ACJJTC_003663 [Scirpophaga incertulas]
MANISVETVPFSRMPIPAQKEFPKIQDIRQATRTIVGDAGGRRRHGCTSIADLVRLIQLVSGLAFRVGVPSLKGGEEVAGCGRPSSLRTRNIQSVRTLRDPHASASHISRATSTVPLKNQLY